MTIRRLKTYTGSQGYVYQYYFVGKRQAPGNATEFVFDVSSDRKTSFATTIILPQPVVAAWNQEHGRPLSETEQYAAVKMRLFKAFDEVPNLQSHLQPLRLDLTDLREGLLALGIDQ